MLAAALLILALADPGQTHDESWQHYGADLAGTRFSPHREVTAENVRRLAESWRFQTGDVSDGSRYAGKSSFKATPIYIEGRLVFSSGFNRVYALDAGTGELVWRFDPEVDFSIRYSEMFTSRGVAYWDSGARGHCAQRVFLGTLDARLIAIDAATGRRCTGFGRGGEIDLSRGIRNFRRGEYSVTSPPLVVNDVVVVGSSIGDNGAVALDSGTVRGFDVRSGELLWSWDPVPRRDSDPGAETWRGAHARTTGAGNVWTAMSADAESGWTFLPTTSPSPDFFGGHRVGRNRFANSIVAVDAKSGSIQWDFQAVHHDLWDHDLASQPTLARTSRGPVIIAPTKMGLVFVLDSQTGKPTFGVEERPVPQTDVPGEETYATQPFPLAPPPLHPIEAIDESDLFELNPEQTAYCRDQLARYRHQGLFTPPSLEGTILYPGNFGGTNWGSAAVDEARGIAVMAVNRLPTVVALIPRDDFEDRRAAMAHDPRNIQFTAQEGTPYGMMRFTFRDPKSGAPCLKGPWGSLAAVSLESGEIRWSRPIGVEPTLRNHPQAARWGAVLAGGPIMTASGLTLVAGRSDARLHVLESRTGKSLRALQLPAGAHATPMSYRHGGRQFIALALGGKRRDDGRPGDYLIAYSLRD